MAGRRFCHRGHRSASRRESSSHDRRRGRRGLCRSDSLVAMDRAAAKRRRKCTPGALDYLVEPWGAGRRQQPADCLLYAWQPPHTSHGWPSCNPGSSTTTSPQRANAASRASERSLGRWRDGSDVRQARRRVLRVLFWPSERGDGHRDEPAWRTTPIRPFVTRVVTHRAAHACRAKCWRDHSMARVPRLSFLPSSASASRAATSKGVGRCSGVKVQKRS